MMLMESAWLVVLGLVIGSFIGAVTWRSVREISIAEGRSFCDSCHHKLTWYDNIPVVSYLLLGGRCRNCKKRISPRYPLTESSFALGFLLIGVFINVIRQNIFVPDGILGLVYILAIFSSLASILITDLENQIIPDNFTFILLGISFTILLLFGGATVYENLFSGFMSGVLLLLLHLATRGKGMGLGDVKLAIPIGLILGLKLSLVWLLGSFVVGSFVGLILLVFKKTSFGKRIAFGPFMVVSLALVGVVGSIMEKLIFIN